MLQWPATLLSYYYVLQLCVKYKQHVNGSNLDCYVCVSCNCIAYSLPAIESVQSGPQWIQSMRRQLCKLLPPGHSHTIKPTTADDCITLHRLHAEQAGSIYMWLSVTAQHKSTKSSKQGTAAMRVRGLCSKLEHTQAGLLCVRQIGIMGGLLLCSRHVTSSRRCWQVGTLFCQSNLTSQVCRCCPCTSTNDNIHTVAWHQSYSV